MASSRRKLTKLVTGFGFIGLVLLWAFNLDTMGWGWSNWVWWERTLILIVLVGVFLYGGVVTLWEGFTGRNINELSWWRRFTGRKPLE